MVYNPKYRIRKKLIIGVTKDSDLAPLYSRYAPTLDFKCQKFSEIIQAWSVNFGGANLSLICTCSRNAPGTEHEKQRYLSCQTVLPDHALALMNMSGGT